jgi:glycosyltransferase involved in cell wall biosynthesis
MRVLVFHTGARDYYQVARAMHEAGILECLVTNGYRYQSPNGLLRLLEAVPAFAGRISSRECPKLPDAAVEAHLVPELLVHGLGRISERLGDRAFAWQERLLAERAAKVAIDSGVDAVLSYSYCAYHLFSQLEGKGIRRLLFQCHPHPDFVSDILREEGSQNPKWGATLWKEKELSWGESYLAQLRAEPQMADMVVAASSFTRKSLVEKGVDGGKIVVVPYGSDSRLGAAPELGKMAGNRQRILFVGQMGQRKGLSYLLEACEGMGMAGRELRVCGRGFDIDPEIRRSKPDWLTIRRDLTEGELAREYSEADVFVLPSLVEGFGLVILEALSFGVPVVTTTSTGAPDVMTDGEEGFIVPPRDSGALRNCIARVLDSEGLRAAMSGKAKLAADRFRWKNFRAKLGAAVSSATVAGKIAGEA